MSCFWMSASFMPSLIQPVTVRCCASSSFIVVRDCADRFVSTIGRVFKLLVGKVPSALRRHAPRRFRLEKPFHEQRNPLLNFHLRSVAESVLCFADVRVSD